MSLRPFTDRSHLVSRHLPRLVCAAAVTLAVIALPAAIALGGGSGLAISPAIIEHQATPGVVGSVTVTNTTGKTLKIKASARRWLQSSTGAVVPDPRHVLSGVSLSPASFSLSNGSTQRVSIRLAAVPAGGSLYGNVDVIGVPTATTRGAVTVDYRLIGSLRLDPARPRYGAKAVAVRVSGTHAHGEISLAVRNTGNTVTPIGGSVTVRGASGAASGTIAPLRIVPGVTVVLPALGLRGSLPAGSYTLTARLTSGHSVSHATAHFTLR
jgi:hypothetical protein